MLSCLRASVGFFALCLALPAGAEEAVRYRATGWVTSSASAVRLIVPVQAKAGGAPLAGIELKLQPGAKTYWRSPGETGVAPTADFSKSTGLSGVALLFPAPEAFDDGAGGVAIGYTRDVIFPVRFTPETAEGQTFHLQFDYGVCHRNMCMPVSAALAAAPGEGTEDEALGRRMAAALAQVPSTQTHPRLSVTRLTPVRTAETLTIEVTARGTGAEPRLFVEAQDIAFTTRPVRVDAGAAVFSAIGPLPAPDAKVNTLTLTLVSGDDAMETTLPLP